MKMEYILIEKEMTVKKEKNNTIYEVSPSPYQLIKKSFENLEVKNSSNRNNKYVRSNWDGSFVINQEKIKFGIKQYSKQKIAYLSIYIKGNRNINTLEIIDSTINKAMTKYYIIITSYDSISEFYCNKIYNKLNKFERKLRELMFKIYTFHYGIHYYERKFSDNLKAKVKTDKSIYSESISIEKIKQALYELTYNEIIDLLFTPKWLEDDEKSKLKLIERIKNENLSSAELVEFINTLKPKSDWERLFIPYIGNTLNMQEIMDELRNLRNSIAHCKFFKKEHYERCLDILKISNRVIDKALKEVTKIDFQELNEQYSSEELQKAIEKLSTYANKMLEQINNSLFNIVLNSLEQLGKVALANTNKFINSLSFPKLNNYHKKRIKNKYKIITRKKYKRTKKN